MHSPLPAEATAEWRVQQLGGIMARSSRTSGDSVASDAVYTTRYTSVSNNNKAIYTLQLGFYKMK